MNRLKTRILTALYGSDDGMTEKELIKALALPKKLAKKLSDDLAGMKKFGDVANKKGVWRLKNRADYFTAVITRVTTRSGFMTERETETPTEYFVRGRDMCGAIPGDVVLAKRTLAAVEDRSAEAVVLAVLEESDALLTGVIVSENNRLMVLPDKLCDEPLYIAKAGSNPLRVGDKVAFSIKKRGERHFDHTVAIADSFGSADNAKAGAEAYMLVNNLHIEFPEEALREAAKLDIDEPDPDEVSRRLDLRGEPIFTIDGADTKDIDDAVSIAKTEGGYKLGVHIADVSHYVKKGSALDAEAFARGTSIYYADRVVPMLPKELSNGICSLNPNVDRLAFSCLMNLSSDGKLLNYRFEKTVIRSRVKGVYSEVNRILDNTADDEIIKKYDRVIDRIPIMRELAEILEKNRANRGAPEIDTVEPKIITDENGVCIDVKPRDRGAAERIIEEFMLVANNAAASLAMKEKIPFVYRIHEPPAAEKLLALGDTLTALGVNPEGISERSTAADLAKVIRDSKDGDKYVVINRIVLRTMMKAKYSDEPLGHYGLVMPEYAHFTSPIRRYADLAIHRILTDYVYALSADKLAKKYKKFAAEASLQASNTELSAVRCERECENLYMAEYMKNHVGEEFEGFISGVSPSGIFVALDNTVEGMISVTRMPLGEYEVQHGVILTGAANGKVFTVGDKMKVKCVSVNVNGGFIDFDFA
ncbi:MAG: ribonuclease R [Lachnospiraceae bacterium]|nr:ribonuclease R [Ruminococcus sp.]MCM1274672.1 ribonuclease R [Lachnospiraceae bacterium]